MFTFRDYQKDYISVLSEAFTQGFNRPCVVAPCGAGKTVLFAGMAQASQNNGKTVWFLVHRKELYDQTIETFERFDIPLNTIHIGMVATIANRLDKFPKPDFIIFDECHFSMAKTWQKIIEAFPKAYIVGLTATPCRLDGKPLGSIYNKLIECTTARQLIEQGYLSPYKYYAPCVADLSALQRKGSDFNADKSTELLSTRAVFGDVIKHYKTYADGKKAICYCSSIRHSEAMAEEFKNNGINAVHFDGSTPKKEREVIIADYRKGEIKILCNVDLVSCGFDCPDCECCILLRPTMSTALYIQQAMRCMRPQEGKTAIILDHVNNYQRHGLPDDEREWSLESTIKPRKEYGEDGILSVRQCKKCFGAYESKLKKCPYCGAEMELSRQEIKNIKEVQLQEIKAERREKAEVKAKTRESIDDCKSVAEMYAWAKAKGYKPGFAYMAAKRKGLLR